MEQGLELLDADGNVLARFRGDAPTPAAEDASGRRLLLKRTA